MLLQTHTDQADILIVDDVLENIRFLSNFLSQQGYQVRKATSGELALKAIAALQPDLILLDIQMPEMGGYEVCERLKRSPQTKDIPIIFLSAENDVNDKVKAFQIGGLDYITKPFQLQEVLVRIQTQLSVRILQKKLKVQNEQLQETILALQQTQAELIQQEKLVSASRIAAGISHEINNPLSFILGNLNPAIDYTQRLIQLAQLYQQEFPETAPRDCDLISSDFLDVMKSIRTEAERIRTVVNALHYFSRLDESGIKPISVVESFESILMLLNHRLQLSQEISISVAKDYSNLPSFLGHAKLFNQALMNLFNNAIDALELKINESGSEVFEPTIWINAWVDREGLTKITIGDNGVGIRDEDEANLFKPFFTTKPFGKGTGLNLFTSHKIITQMHQGRLTYQKNSSGGTEFVIELPSA